jgi:hypothetical protein
MANSTATLFYGELPTAAITSIRAELLFAEGIARLLDGDLIFDSVAFGHGVALNRRDG